MDVFTVVKAVVIKSSVFQTTQVHFTPYTWRSIGFDTIGDVVRDERWAEYKHGDKQAANCMALTFHVKWT